MKSGAHSGREVVSAWYRCSRYAVATGYVLATLRGCLLGKTSEASMRHRIYFFVIVGLIITGFAISDLTSAHQSPEPLNGNWVVRTATTNNDGTFRTTYLNLKQEGRKITGTIRVTQFYYK